MNRSIIKAKLSILTAVFLLAGINAPMPSSAVSFPLQLYHSEERHDKFVKGESLYLFHSGTNEVSKTIHINETLAVYRINRSCEVVPVGVIRVLSFVGETHIKGEVMAGEIRPDDIAKKNGVSCLVISAGICQK